MAGGTPTSAGGPGEPDSEGTGLYLEAQTGVAPSQSHVFPLPKNATVEWTEWFHAFQADRATIQVGLYPIVTLQYGSTTLYQVSYHMRYLFF